MIENIRERAKGDCVVDVDRKGPGPHKREGMYECGEGARLLM